MVTAGFLRMLNCHFLQSVKRSTPIVFQDLHIYCVLAQEPTVKATAWRNPDLPLAPSPAFRKRKYYYPGLPEDWRWTLSSV